MITVIGDSILRGVGFPNAYVQVCPGVTTARLARKIRNGVVSVWGWSIIILHVGTNDIDSPLTESDIIADFELLIAEVRWRNPAALLLISGIMPRPCDGHTSRYLEKVQAVNAALHQLCMRTTLSHFLRSWRCVCHTFGGVVPDMYLYKTDQLHLSGAGTYSLSKFLYGSVESYQGMLP